MNLLFSKEENHLPSHYFTEDETVISSPKKITYYYMGKKYIFTTDNGVFSVGEVDNNTDILLHNIPKLRGSLLDMGCGYGCIGIVLAKTYSLDLYQADINPRAAALTEENCAQNGVASNIYISDCYSNINGNYDTIVINPPIHAGKNVMNNMFEGAREHLNANGKLYVVILKKHGAESTITKLAEIFGGCEIIYKKKGCYVLSCENIIT